MEAVKKYWLWGIFISILSIFAMSHNASALNFNAEFYDLNRAITRPSISCLLSSGQTSEGARCTFISEANDLRLRTIRTVNTLNNLKAGDLVEYYLVVSNTQNNDISGGTLNMKDFASTDGLELLDLEVIDDYSKLDFVVSSQNLPGENVGFVSDFWTLNQIGKVYKVIQRVAIDGNHYIGFDNSSSQSSTVYVFSWYQNTNYTLEFAMRDFKVWRPTESKENKEVEEKTQGAVDDSQTAGGSSSQDAQTGTTGLLNAITGAVNVISAARPTNCKINGNMGNLDMGQLDLCANPAPAFIQTIGSLILILMCVPLAISLFNRFITIFRSFQS